MVCYLLVICLSSENVHISFNLDMLSLKWNITSKIVMFREVRTASLLSKQEDLLYSIHLFGA